MAYLNKPLQPVSITAPGFFGLNNQDSGIDMNPAFALQAYNAVIDRYGRIGARKGWSYVTTSGGTSTNPEALSLLKVMAPIQSSVLGIINSSLAQPP
jgi:hypothetical protein